MEVIFKEIVQFVRKLYLQPKGLIPLHTPVFAGNEKKYLEECIDSTFVSTVGSFVDHFEEKISDYTGAKKAVACVNGTSALHLALKLVGVTPETEVITQPLTFIATANAISYCEAYPVFLDVDKDTMGLSPSALKSWLNQNVELREFPVNKFTKRRVTACVPMHTFGFPCRIDEITEICKDYNIPVVEDAAESLGSFYKKQHTGTFGKIGVLSFNGNKIITTGGGGMLLFDDLQLAEKAKHLTIQAKVPHPWEFEHDQIGYNYRMPNINAALGLAQLEKINEFLELKQEIAESYKEFFSKTAMKKTVVEMFTGLEYASSNNWLNCLLFKDKTSRDDFLRYSNKNGVMARPSWKLMHTMEMYRDSQTGNLSNSEYFAERLVNLPSSVVSH